MTISYGGSAYFQRMDRIPESQAFAERLRKALEVAGVRRSPTVVANEFNLRFWGRSITPHTARNWLLGQALPTQDKLMVLAEWLQVSPDELRFGKAASGSRLSDADAQFEQLDMADREMIKRYLHLPRDQRKTVRDVVAAMSAASDPLRQTGTRQTTP
jgi:transcriptional regulator with XRE-family HTH domain